MAAKGKGSSFERDIARMISLWFSEEKSADWFWRTQSSGGRATQLRKTGKMLTKQFGDIVAVEKEGEPLTDKFCFELKTGYGASRKKNEKKVISNWCILDGIDSKQKETVFDKFWKQCVNDADASHRIPILIFRRNLMSCCIAMKSNLHNRLKEWYGPVHTNKGILYFESRFGDIVFMNLDDFFSWTPSFLPFINFLNEVRYVSRTVGRPKNRRKPS